MGSEGVAAEGGVPSPGAGGGGALALLWPLVLGLLAGWLLGAIYAHAHRAREGAEPLVASRLLLGLVARIALAVFVFYGLMRFVGPASLLGAALGFAIMHVRAAVERSR